jgi:long-chain acyl-CoA synthetase
VCAQVADAPGLDRQSTAQATIVANFWRQVETRASAPAMYFRAGERYAPITWADFGKGVRRLMAYLLSEGLAEQEHVGIWAGNRPEWHIADVAVLSTRCRPVPVYLTLSAEQAQYVLGHSEARVLFIESDELCAGVLQQRDRLPSLQRVVVMDRHQAGSSDPLVISWADALAGGENALQRGRRDLDARAASVTLDDVATLIYTSGTTGPPKAVLLTHRNVAAANHALDEFVHTTADERVLSYLPLAHIAERLSTEFRSYAHGHAVWFCDGIANLGKRLHEVRPTMFFGVPRVWEKMAAQVQKGVAELPPPRRAVARWAIKTGGHELARRREAPQSKPSLSYRLADRLVLRKLRVLLGFDEATVLVSGAAPLAPEVIRFFGAIGLELLEEYGQTEDTGTTSMNRPGAARAGTVGRAFRGVELRIAEDGEILVRGDVVFHGYHKDAAATAEALADGWLHTGDVGEVDADGFLRITDRKKDLIITAGGKNISPSAIEGPLQQHTLIGHAVAIGDRRPFMSALLTLDPEEARAYGRAHGLGDDLAALARDPELRRQIEGHVAAVNSGLSHVEQIKKWELLPEDFTIGDELTPTLKVKRKTVNEKYADEIERLYAKG